MIRFSICGLIWLVVMAAATAVPAEAPAESVVSRPNLALDAGYNLSPAPNYPHCTDPDDATQLTDGRLTTGYFWTQPGTVGWKYANYVAVTVDLRTVQPIGGVSFRTAAGIAGVAWPAAIRIHVSDDGEAYRDIGDLLELDESARDLPETYAVRRLAASKLQTRGRFIRFLVMPAGPYVFTDEVEVFRGDDSLLKAEPTGKPVGDLEAGYVRCRVEAGIRRRFNADVAGLQHAVRQASVPPSAREALLGRLEKVEKKLREGIPVDGPSSFRAVLPFNEAHAELFRIQAKLWAEQKNPSLRAWAVCPWDPLDLFSGAGEASTGRIEVHTMLGEYRSAAFNVANSGETPVRVSFHFTGLPDSPTPPSVTAYRVPWTDTITGKPVASALVELAPENGSWTVEAVPGLVQQVWLGFHITGLPAGRYDGSLVVRAAESSELSVPAGLRVYPLRFPTRTSLIAGGWSYTDGTGRYGITPNNREELIKHLRGHFINAPWATAAVMMNFRVEGDSDPVIRLDTSRFDEWLEKWPEARTYFVFLSVGRTFAKAQLGTEDFRRRVGAWISAWVRHLAGKRIGPERLGLLLVDEPRQHAQDEIIIAWAEAIQAAEPDVLVWEDPVYRDPTQGKAEMFAVCDILCPNRPMWLAAGKPFAQFYLDQKNSGRTLQLYSCSGPARLLDPYSYYRLQAWHCRQIGGTGTFFWAFGDNSGTSSWNEYAAVRGPYTPLFLDERSVTPAKQMEAVRESIEDYEYFVMLEEATKHASQAKAADAKLAAARSLLGHGPDEVLGAAGATELLWHTQKDRTRADVVRVALLEVLADLTGSSRK